MTSMQVYWITRLDYFNQGAGLFFFISLVIGGLFIIQAYISKWEHRKNYAIIVIILSSFFGILVCLIPTTQDMAFILLAPKIANSKFIQQIPPDMMQLKELAMEYVEEKLKDEKKK